MLHSSRFWNPLDTLGAGAGVSDVEGRCAAWVRLSGAAGEHGLTAAINGDYVRTENSANGRPVYNKLGKAGTSLWWYSPNEQWMVGHTKRAGTDSGILAMVDCPGCEGGPESAEGVWQAFDVDAQAWMPQDTMTVESLDDPVRPGIVQRLCETRVEPAASADENARLFEIFQLHVQENNMQLARFDFLQMRCYYEGLQVGPSNPGVPSQGATALEMIFKYYASRRQNSVEGGHLLTFDDIQKANATMDMSELTKFMKEFLPGMFNRKETNWLFKMANTMEHGLSDDSAFTMDFDEFVGVLCAIAMQVYRGDHPRVMAKKLGKMLGLSEPLMMREKLRRMGLADAGFGAWKNDEYKIPGVKYDSKVRCVLGVDAAKYCLGYHDFIVLKKELMEGFPDVKIPDWIPFPGALIAFVYPKSGVREGKRIRFKVEVRNVAPRAIDIFARLVDLPTVSMLESGEKGSIAPGMHKTVTIVLEEIQVGCQVGGIIFSAEENGPEIFRCPIFLRATDAVKEAVGHHICSEMASEVDLSEMRAKFQVHDIDQSGRVSVDLFQQAIAEIGYDLSENQKGELQHLQELEKSDGEVKVDYDDFVTKLSEMRSEQNSPTKLLERSSSVCSQAPKRSQSVASAANVSAPTSPQMNAPPLSRSPTGERKKISDPPHRLMDPIEAKIAERGFAMPLVLEHAVPMSELNQQLREIMSMKRNSIATPSRRTTMVK